jgi:hypothetical protein
MFFHTKPKEHEENPDKIGFNREPLNPEPDNLSSYNSVVVVGTPAALIPVPLASLTEAFTKQANPMPKSMENR